MKIVSTRERPVSRVMTSMNSSCLRRRTFSARRRKTARSSNESAPHATCAARARPTAARTSSALATLISPIGFFVKQRGLAIVTDPYGAATVRINLLHADNLFGKPTADRVLMTACLSAGTSASCASWHYAYDDAVANHAAEIARMAGSATMSGA